jgi:hypothetical protein
MLTQNYQASNLYRPVPARDKKFSLSGESAIEFAALSTTYPKHAWRILMPGR